MASIKVSELNATTTTAANSFLLVSDTTNGVEFDSKKITVANFLGAYATEAFVNSAISDLINGAPQALDTLKEISDAIGDSDDLVGNLIGMINANEGHVDNMATLTGVLKDAADLGTFTGSTISDSSTIKSALQALETSLETKGSQAQLNTVTSRSNDLVALTGLASGSVNLGEFTGSTLSDNATLKTVLQETEAAIEANDVDISALQSRDLELLPLAGGTMTGTLNVGTGGVTSTYTSNAAIASGQIGYEPETFFDGDLANYGVRFQRPATQPEEPSISFNQLTATSSVRLYVVDMSSTWNNGAPYLSVNGIQTMQADYDVSARFGSIGTGWHDVSSFLTFPINVTSVGLITGGVQDFKYVDIRAIEIDGVLITEGMQITTPGVVATTINSDGTASFSGLISAATAPTANEHLTNKEYVDTKLPLAGGNMSGDIEMGEGQQPYVSNVTVVAPNVSNPQSLFDSDGWGGAAAGSLMHMSGSDTPNYVSFSPLQVNTSLRIYTQAPLDRFEIKLNQNGTTIDTGVRGTGELGWLDIPVNAPFELTAIGNEGSAKSFGIGAIEVDGQQIFEGMLIGSAPKSTIGVDGTASFSGLVSAATAPTSPAHLANKQYVDGVLNTENQERIANDALKLDLAGGTMSGAIQLGVGSAAPGFIAADSNSALMGTTFASSYDSWRMMHLDEFKSSGKHYIEFTVDSLTAGNITLGVLEENNLDSVSKRRNELGRFGTAIGWRSDSTLWAATTETSWGISPAPTHGLGDVIGVLLDMDARTVQFSKNGDLLSKVIDLPGTGAYTFGTSIYTSSGSTQVTYQLSTVANLPTDYAIISAGGPASILNVDGTATFVSNVTASVAPTANAHLTNKLYVDNTVNAEASARIANDALKLDLAGGTMSGAIQMGAGPAEYSVLEAPWASDWSEVGRGSTDFLTVWGNDFTMSSLELPTTGKSFMEITATGFNSTGNFFIGIVETSVAQGAGETSVPGILSNSYSLYPLDGDLYQNGSTVNNNYFSIDWPSSTNWEVTDHIGIGYDADTREVRYFINGVDYGVAFTVDAGTYRFAMRGSATTQQVANFGATAFAYPIDGYSGLGGEGEAASIIGVDGTATFGGLVSAATAPTAGEHLTNKQYVDNKAAVNAAAIESLTNGAPELLNTLNELAEAIGDDENFSTTITNLITTESTNRADADTVLQNNINTTNANLTQEVADRQAADALLLPLAGGTMSGSIQYGVAGVPYVANPSSDFAGPNSEGGVGGGDLTRLFDGIQRADGPYVDDNAPRVSNSRAESRPYFAFSPLVITRKLRFWGTFTSNGGQTLRLNTNTTEVDTGYLSPETEPQAPSQWFEVDLSQVTLPFTMTSIGVNANNTWFSVHGIEIDDVVITEGMIVNGGSSVATKINVDGTATFGGLVAAATAPTADEHLTNKLYVDTLHETDSTNLTTEINTRTSQVAALQATDASLQSQVTAEVAAREAADAQLLRLTGGTMAGAIELGSAPGAPSFVPVDNNITVDGSTITFGNIPNWHTAILDRAAVPASFTGKYYYELSVTDPGRFGNLNIGVNEQGELTAGRSASAVFLRTDSGQLFLHGEATIADGFESNYAAVGNVIGVLVDGDNDTVSFTVNGALVTKDGESAFHLNGTTGNPNKENNIFITAFDSITVEVNMAPSSFPAGYQAWPNVGNSGGAATSIGADGSASFSGLISASSVPTENQHLTNKLYVDTQVAANAAAIEAVVGGAPELLNTLNELAEAISDDENFATTITSTISAETSARTAADANLQTQVDAEVAARTAAVNLTNTNLTQEVADRQAADALLLPLAGGTMSGAINLGANVGGNGFEYSDLSAASFEAVNTFGSTVTISDHASGIEIVKGARDGWVARLPFNPTIGEANTVSYQIVGDGDITAVVKANVVRVPSGVDGSGSTFTNQYAIPGDLDLMGGDDYGEESLKISGLTQQSGTFTFTPTDATGDYFIYFKLTGDDKFYIGGLSVTPLSAGSAASVLGIDGTAAFGGLVSASSVPTADEHLTNKLYVDTKSAVNAAAVAANTANLAQEVSDRTAADTTLQSNIDAEAATRTANDNTLTTNLAQEVTDRQAADALLLPLAGGTMSGDILFGGGTQAFDSATMVTTSGEFEMGWDNPADLFRNGDSDRYIQPKVGTTLTFSTPIPVTSSIAFYGYWSGNTELLINGQSTGWYVNDGQPSWRYFNFGSDGNGFTTDAITSIGLGQGNSTSTNGWARLIFMQIDGSGFFDGTLVTGATSTTLGLNGSASFSGLVSASTAPTADEHLTNKLYVDQKAAVNAAAIEAVVGGAPELLNTLNELAQAISDDENFSATITNQIAAETSARTAADNTLTTNLNAETASRIAGDQTLTSDLSQEITDRQAADALKLDLAGGTMSGPLQMGGTVDVPYVSDIATYGETVGPNDLNAVFDPAEQTQVGYFSYRNGPAGVEFNPLTVKSSLRLHIYAQDPAQIILNKTIETGLTQSNVPWTIRWIDVTSELPSLPFDLTAIGFNSPVHNTTTSISGIEIDGVFVDANYMLTGEASTVTVNTDGTASFAGVVSGASPTDPSHLTNKLYVDGLTSTNVASINTLTTNLAQEVSDRQAGDATLTTNLAQEISDRIAAVAALTNGAVADNAAAIAQEVVDRTAADALKVDKQSLVNEHMLGQTSAQSVPVDAEGKSNYLFLVVDKATGALKSIDKQFLEAE
jgi:hypothetical protein